jgi:16S rRNA (uracil1498-N3)-methyltransferase
MYQFFVEPRQVQGQQIFIEGSDVNHIRNVLRMKAGERVRVSDNSGKAYICHIQEIAKEVVTAAIDAVDELGTELPNRIILFQGLPKADKMELVIQKSVELGVAEVIPVAMKNCVVRLDDKKAAAKVSRWQAIAESAAKQSKRTIIPEIHEPVGWKEALNLAKILDIMLVPYENERGMEFTRSTINRIAPGQSVGILIGPEGGFSDAEIADTDALGFHRISLGRRILRTETAGLAALAMLVYQLDR